MSYQISYRQCSRAGDVVLANDGSVNLAVFVIYMLGPMTLARQNTAIEHVDVYFGSETQST